MIKTSRQLKDLIRNMAKNHAADAQILLRNYMMERFLERISLSEYKDNFILKGGMLVAAMVGLDARSTMDIDATVKDTSVNVEDVENIVAGIVGVHVDDGVDFRVKSISEIMDEAEYPGVRVNLDCYFDGTRTPLKIDISTGDVITPKEIRYSFKLMFEERTIDVWAYNLETVVAEKLETIIARTTTNTRMRDFYDLHILHHLYGNTMNKGVLTLALTATADKRGSVNLLTDAEKVLCDVHNSAEMQGLWDNYRKKFSYALDISWSSVMRSVRQIAIDTGLPVKKPSVLEHLSDRKEQAAPTKKTSKHKSEPER